MKRLTLMIELKIAVATSERDREAAEPAAEEDEGLPDAQRRVGS